jgi:electron transfer flavoprotein beta subunit
VQVDAERRKVTVHRYLEDGIEVAETSLPVLITALKELNKVRRASLPGMIRAARYKPVTWTTADFPAIEISKIGLKGSPTIVSKTWVPEVRKVNGQMIEGDTPVEVAEQLIRKLWESDLREKLG